MAEAESFQFLFVTSRPKTHAAASLHDGNCTRPFQMCFPVLMEATGIGSYGSGVMCGCELPDVRAGN